MCVCKGEDEEAETFLPALTLFAQNIRASTETQDTSEIPDSYRQKRVECVCERERPRNDCLVTLNIVFQIQCLIH